MFYSEKPIISKNEDLLGRKKVASDLAKEIEYYKNKDSLTIGIVGKWGSGKTSFINMVLESFKGNNNYIVIKFNPWNISSRKQLISDFFLQLSNSIKKEDMNAEIMSTIGKSLGILSKFFKPLGLISPLSLLGTIGDITEKASGFINEYLEAEKEDLETLKSNINQELEDLDKKLLIVIDDIDRLCDEEIREIFQLVKSIADFKNTIYILSYDREIVTKALDKTQQDKGEEYLEKIVQVPLVLPYISKSDLDKIFINRLNITINIPDEEYDNSYFSEIYYNGLAENFESLRDIERYMNVFSLGINLAREELNINDYIAITLIKVFETDLYEYIKNNKEYFSGTKFDEFLNKNKKEILTELEGIYEKLKKLEKRKAKRLIEIIFPKLGEMNYAEGFVDIWGKARRIATPVYFESYFRLDFPEDEIKKSEIKKFREFSTEEDLIKIFNINNKKRIRLLELLIEEIEEISDEKAMILLNFIFSIVDELKYEGPKGIFSFIENPQYKVTRIFYRIISNTNRNRYKIMKELFKYDNSSLQLLFSILDKLNNSFLKNNLESEYGIKENQLISLRDIAVTKILKESEKSKRIESRLLNILYTMQRLGKEEEAKKVFKNYLKNKDLLIDFIKEFISTRTTEINYSIRESTYLLKDSINDFYDYEKFVKLVDENFTNPNEEEAEVINQLENAITREELQKD
ncbi:KAP family P-loop NTPase fold protein [Fusobacterium polymorphum]|jgi:KAP family P-loop domain-containing protein|uniref:KAP family P-loop NTPase fold protein n=1 Tax=Fusobacterium nucleatum subsp. polymorphum TaxID=76857 RepID=UPI001C6E7D8A|nr:P-loop NTPase fold protein [Fusobacterium polymorphum]QYR58348.1 AAA family ATPase [Fusobacterium polymorphum]